MVRVLPFSNFKRAHKGYVQWDTLPGHNIIAKCICPAALCRPHIEVVYGGGTVVIPLRTEHRTMVLYMKCLCVKSEQLSSSIHSLTAYRNLHLVHEYGVQVLPLKYTSASPTGK